MVQERLLDIAVREFAAKGLDGTSTRGIAAAAGTAMSSITYHYGGKEGLYLAAAEHIASEMTDVTGDLGTSAVLFAGDPGPARDAIHAVLERMVDKLAHPQSESWSLFIVREQMQPTDAFERIWHGPMAKMFETLTELVMVATGRDDRQTARIVVLTLFGQVVVLRAARATCAKLTGGDCADAGFVAAYRTQVAANIDAILHSMTIDQRGHA